MQLFLICCEHYGENFDRFISAKSPDQAVAMWMETDYVKDHEAQDAPLQVFRVPSVSPTPMAHDWHGVWSERGVKCVGSRI